MRYFVLRKTRTTALVVDVNRDLCQQCLIKFIKKGDRSPSRSVRRLLALRQSTTNSEGTSYTLKKEREFSHDEREKKSYYRRTKTRRPESLRSLVSRKKKGHGVLMRELQHLIFVTSQVDQTEGRESLVARNNRLQVTEFQITKFIKIKIRKKKTDIVHPPILDESNEV